MTGPNPRGKFSLTVLEIAYWNTLDRGGLGSWAGPLRPIPRCMLTTFNSDVIFEVILFTGM